MKSAVTAEKTLDLKSNEVSLLVQIQISLKLGTEKYEYSLSVVAIRNHKFSVIWKYITKNPKFNFG